MRAMFHRTAREALAARLPRRESLRPSYNAGGTCCPATRRCGPPSRPSWTWRRALQGSGPARRPRRPRAAHRPRGRGRAPRGQRSRDRAAARGCPGCRSPRSRARPPLLPSRTWERPSYETEAARTRRLAWRSSAMSAGESGPVDRPGLRQAGGRGICTSQAIPRQGPSPAMTTVSGARSPSRAVAATSSSKPLCGRSRPAEVMMSPGPGCEGLSARPPGSPHGASEERCFDHGQPVRSRPSRARSPPGRLKVRARGRRRGRRGYAHRRPSTRAV